MPDRDYRPQGYPTVHRRHEGREANARLTFLTAAGLIVLAVILQFLLWLLLRGMQTRPGPRVPALLSTLFPPRVPPPPRLQADPARDLIALRAQEKARLNSYGWTDRARGAVHIPIERAKDLLLEHGLPPASPLPPAPRLPVWPPAEQGGSAVVSGGGAERGY
jgi:hypothetical protein